MGIWKMQLPPMLRRMSLCELTSTYKGDISAALKKSRDEKVVPQMTPLVRRSVRRAAAVSRMKSSGIQTVATNASDGISYSIMSSLAPSGGGTRRTVLSGKTSSSSSPSPSNLESIVATTNIGTGITSIMTSGGVTMEVDDANAARLELAKFDILSSTMLHHFMTQTSSTSDFDKVAALAALKRQIAIIEKAMPNTMATMNQKSY